VGKIASGTALAQVISLATMPLLTRMYGPEAFGIYGILVAVSSPLLVLVNGRYDLAIVLPSKDSDGAALFRLACKIAVIMSLILGAIFYFGRSPIAQLFETPAFAEFFWFIPIFALFTGLSQAQSSWTLRKKKFGLLTKAAPLAAGAGSILSISLGLIAGIPEFILIGTLANPLVTATYLWKHNTKTLQINKVSEHSDHLAAKYKDFPLYRAPQDFLNAVSQNVMGIMLAYYFNPAAIAQYWLAQRIIAAPLSLISNAIGQVFYQKSAEMINAEGDIYSELKQKTIVLAYISIPLFSVAAICLPYIFPLVFGNEWKTAGLAGSWLALWYGTMFVNTPAVRALDVCRFQKFKLFYGIFVLTSRLLVVYYFASRGNFLTTVAAFSITGAIVNLLLIALTLFFVNKQAKTPNFN
jgi:O-antigen/teichoic acid export membrane protein